MEILQGPDEKQMNFIRADLGEDQDRFENNLNLLQKWMSCQPHLPQNYDPKILPIFLRGCKHNLERTKKKLEGYFVARLTIPEFYANRDPGAEEIERIMQIVNIIPLPKLTPEGRRVSLLNLASTDPSEFDMKTILRYAFMIADIRTFEESPIAGDIFIYNMAGISPEHCARFVSPFIKKAIMLSSTIYPQRMYMIHLINVPTLAEKLIQFTKSVVKAKIRDRFTVHKNSEGLLDYIPKEVLPKEYHGTEESVEVLKSKWLKCILNHAEWFRKQENVKASGTVPNSVIHACGLEDPLGIQGSFRQLAID